MGYPDQPAGLFLDVLFMPAIRVSINLPTGSAHISDPPLELVISQGKCFPEY
jgi:hypothetical protein